MSITKSTITTYEYNSGTRELNIPFDYLRRDFVVVTLSGKGKPQKTLKLGVDYKFTSKTTITVIREYQPDEGFNKIIIRRVTDATKRIVNFQDGSILNSSELNISQLQSLHVAEEARDLSSYTLFVDDEGNLDARGRKIINLGDPSEKSSDAVNVKFIEGTKDTILGARDETIKAKEEACACAEKAKVSETNAKSSEKSAEKSKQASQSSQEASAKSQQKAAESANNAQRDAASASASRLAAKGSEDSALASAKRAEAAAGRVDGIPKENLKGEFGVNETYALNQKFLSESFAHIYQTWDKGLTYSKGDMVKGSDNLVYRAYESTTKEDPTTTPTKWFLVSTFVNVRDYGAKGDGVTDDSDAIQNAFNNPKGLPTFIPAGIYGISKTIKLDSRFRTMFGVEQRDRSLRSSTLKWIGPTDNRATMIQFGLNAVGAEPTNDASGIKLYNVFLDGDNKVGFLVYGTYLVNEAEIRNVAGEGSLEYNFYFARGWYATITNLLSGDCKNNGIALGMPLEYSDGTKVTWSTDAPHELNNLYIRDIRSHSAGRGLTNYNPVTSVGRRRGYGIGAGIGNGFRLDSFLSEGSGGAGLYVYTGPQPSKSISRGYLENNCTAMTSDEGKANIILESAHAYGDTVNIHDIFNNRNTGGIYHFLSDDLADSNIFYKITDVQSGKFFRDYGPRSVIRPFSKHGANFTFKNSSGYFCYYNNSSSNRNIASSSVAKKINVRYSWEYVSTIGDTRDVLIKRLDNNYTNGGTYYAYDDEGKQITSRSLPNVSDLPLNTWVRFDSIGGVHKLVAANPQGGSQDCNVMIKLVQPTIAY